MKPPPASANRFHLVSAPVYVVLLHYPITNRNGEVVTTAVTNMDIHDISRSARTYGCRGYFVVTPIEDQHELIGRILSHWRTDQSNRYHPDRFEAVSLVRLVHTFQDVLQAVRAEHPSSLGWEEPEVVLTDARPPEKLAKLFGKEELEEELGRRFSSYADYRRELEDPKRMRPVIIVFGTGWGVSDIFYPEVHRILAPIYGPEGKDGYNHLSVRSAVAIIFDRLFGK